jgi:hypothetical protein
MSQEIKYGASVKTGIYQSQSGCNRQISRIFRRAICHICKPHKPTHKPKLAKEANSFPTPLNKKLLLKNEKINL